jgi:hypothetical protein
VKNLLQQRHLRRIGGRLMARATSESHDSEESEKEQPNGPQTRRRKKSFGWKSGKKIQPKKTELQTACSPPLSFRR